MADEPMTRTFYKDDLEILELSAGCSHHDGPLCLKMRDTNTGEVFHFPGSIEKVDTDG